ncbi:hDIG domain protein [Clostridium sp. CAG:632]|jgi:putative nucleotidyltransferase with HDIG domain|nr:HD domain-containing protein [Clostridium sp.]CCY57711.1 hDIG domain protein [Clostridium sp. CAG:632]
MEMEQDVFSGETINEYLSEDLSAGLLHAMCVSDLAAKLARELGLTEDQIQEIALAGMVHDIGKLKISRYIYGRQEDTMRIEETQYIRRHAQLGEQILRKQGFSDNICNMVLYHHENYDGSGYPFNLRGEEIPLGARILRVCDVFAALIADRPYRKAFDINTAIRLLIDEVKNFDMRIFLAFQSVVHTQSTLEELEEIEGMDGKTHLQKMPLTAEIQNIK